MPVVDKSTSKKIKLIDQKGDYAYWVKQSFASRLEALESIREEFNSWKFDDQQGFQRVYRVIKQK